MKYRLLAVSLPLLATLSVSVSAAGDPPLDTDLKRFSYGVGLQVGHGLSRQGMVEIDADTLAAAIAEVLAGRPPRLSRDELIASRKAYMERAAAQRSVAAARNLDEGNKFLAENRSAEGVKALESGVQYRVLASGAADGASPALEDSVRVNYRGSRLDGGEFDSSYRRGKPTRIEVGKVIPGWREVLPMMKEGDRWEVWIPSQLAYGENGAGPGVGPNQLLHFEIELLAVEHAAKAADGTQSGG